MKNRLYIFFAFLPGILHFYGQNSTFSPYSRYGLGIINSPVLSQNGAMGAYLALKPDSVAPIFLNTGNPASYALIKVTSLEIGGRFNYSNLKSSGPIINQWTTNFSYVALGFPVRKNGGACLGVMPYSQVGYEVQSISNTPQIGDVTYQYSGNGGLSNAFIGYGIMPFNKRLQKFRAKYHYIPDSMKTMSRFMYRMREFNNKWISDLTLGFNANYVFGNIEHISRVVYPNSLLYNNTYRERIITMGDFTGNFGVQTAFTADSVRDYKGRRKRMEKAIQVIKTTLAPGDSGKAGTGASSEWLKIKTDSIITNTPLRRRALSEKFKVVGGFFMNLNNPMKSYYTTAAYNYVLGSSGAEILRDTAYKITEQKKTLRLPLEQGVGIALKKGERLTVAADLAMSNWQAFNYFDESYSLATNYRVSLGMNYTPEKYATGRGTFFSRVNYRFGVTYNSGYIKIHNTTVPEYNISLGLGLPVGPSRYSSSIVNLTLQYGRMGYNLYKSAEENYFRLALGFTYSDRWFQKFRYD